MPQYSKQMSHDLILILGPEFKSVHKKVHNYEFTVAVTCCLKRINACAVFFTNCYSFQTKMNFSNDTDDEM